MIACLLLAHTCTYWLITVFEIDNILGNISESQIYCIDLDKCSCVGSPNIINLNTPTSYRHSYISRRPVKLTTLYPIWILDLACTKLWLARTLPVCHDIDNQLNDKPGPIVGCPKSQFYSVLTYNTMKIKTFCAFESHYVNKHLGNIVQEREW